MRELPPLPADTAERARDLAGRFPADFVWGAATAAAQIEGSPDVDDDGRRTSLEDQLTQLHQIGMSLQSCSPEQR